MEAPLTTYCEILSKIRNNHFGSAGSVGGAIHSILPFSTSRAVSTKRFAPQGSPSPLSLNIHLVKPQSTRSIEVIEVNESMTKNATGMATDLRTPG